MQVSDFQQELEVFGAEEEAAQQAFFAYLSVRNLAASDQDVLTNMQSNALFWRTTHHSLLMSAFVTLGRIFDQNSDHNIDRLLGKISDNIGVFTKGALRSRKIAAGLSHRDADGYVQDAYELSATDVRRLKRLVKKWRDVYEKRYRDVRHKVFAHKNRREVVEAALAQTNVDEIKDLFGFLAGLYEALWQLYHNGREPVVEVQRFVLPPNGALTSMSPGERIYLEAHEVLRMVTPPDTDERH